jgi:AcrR family transcriptional regulator
MKSRDERPRSPRRDEAKAGKRRRVLAAAMEVFAREGYHAARMDAIAEAAGVSKGALYFHFPGKLPLFFALVDEFAAELGADVATAIAAYQGGVARVEAAVTSALSLFGRRCALARIVHIEAASPGPAYATKRREISAASPR